MTADWWPGQLPPSPSHRGHLSLVIIIQSDKLSDKWWHTQLLLLSTVSTWKLIADGYQILCKVAWLEVVYRNVPARRRQEGNIFQSLSHSFSYLIFEMLLKIVDGYCVKNGNIFFFRWNCVSWVNWLPFTNEGRDIWLSRLDSPALARQNKTFISSNRSKKTQKLT